MRTFALSLALSCIAVVPISGADKTAVPVVVELFTSQGCHSCPPADAFLRELGKQPVRGIEIIPVSWHVDYWNRLGWTDPFSSKVATDRQNKYARQLNARGLYTPQMVVDGRSEFVGSDRRRGLAVIKRALDQEKSALDVEATRRGDRITITATAENADDNRRVMAVITQDNVETAVKRGENGGRTLQHHGVVRASGDMQPADPGAWTLSLAVPKDAADLKLVVIVQDETGHVVAAATQSIPT